MRVLLVGGLGFIGRRFIRKFSDTYDIVVFATSMDISNYKQLINETKIKAEQGFVEDQNLVEIITRNKPDVVIHLAALTGLKKCHENPSDAFRINVYGTFNVVSSCMKSQSKLIFISSREVYGETLHNESKEDDPPLPKNVYGITKMLGEILIQKEGSKNNLDYTILRLTNVYGPEGDQYGAQVIIRDAMKSKKVKLLGGEQRLNFVYVDDVVDIINQVITDKRSSKQVFNVGSTDTLAMQDFVSEVSKVLKTEFEIEHLPMRETETINFKPSLNKLKNVLGFSVKTSIGEGIQKTIQWYMNH
jgi:UDP-glucose 4-epimerase